MEDIAIVIDVPRRAGVEPPLGHKTPRIFKVVFQVEGRPVGHLQNGALGDEAAVDDGASLGHKAVDSGGQGRVDAEGLVEDGQQVGKFGDGGKVDFVLSRLAVGVGTADFALQVREFVRVAKEVVDGDGEEGGGRLAAGHDKDVAVGIELVGGDAAGLANVFLEAGNEVGTVRLAGQTAVDLVPGGLGVRNGLGPNLFGHEHLQKGAPPAHGEHHLAVHHHGEVGEDEGDPGVELAVLDAVKRLAKGQVADNVKGEVIEPGPHVDHLAAGRARAQLLAEQRRIRQDNGLLRLEAGVAEAGAEDLAVAAVLGVRLEPGEARGAKHALVVFAERRLWRHGALAVAVAVNVVRGRGRGVGELVGREAHHGPVLFVELEHGLVHVALDLLEHFGQVGAAV